MCGPSPIFYFSSWRVLVRKAEFEGNLMLSNHPSSNYRDGTIKQPKIICCPPTPAAAPELMSLKAASLPPRRQQLRSD